MNWFEFYLTGFLFKLGVSLILTGGFIGFIAFMNWRR